MFQAKIYVCGEWIDVNTGDDHLELFEETVAGAQEFNEKAERANFPYRIENVCVVEIPSEEIWLVSGKELLEDY